MFVKDIVKIIGELINNKNINNKGGFRNEISFIKIKDVE